MKSIKSKLIVYFSFLILLASLTIGITSILIAKNGIAAEAEHALTTMAHESAKVTEARINEEKKTMEIIAGMRDIQTMNWAIQRPLLMEHVKNTDYLDIGVVDLEGNALYSDGTKAELGDREYVKIALNGQTNISDILISQVTNSLVVMYATPIESNGNIVGALIGRRDGAFLSQITDDIKYGEKGYGYVINNEGTLVGHSNLETVMAQYNPIEAAKDDKSVEEVASMFEKIIMEEEGLTGYKTQGNNLYSSFSPIPDTNWILVIEADEKEILNAIPQMMKNIILTIIIFLAISLFVTYFIGNSIAKPILEAVRQSEHIVNLDLSQDIPSSLLNRKDEVGSLGLGFQQLTNSLRDIIKEIDYSSGQVAATSEELTATTQQSSIAAEDVSKTAEQIAEGASEQASNTENGSFKAVLLGEVIEKDEVYMDSLNNSSHHVSQVIDDGLNEINNLANITEESNIAAKEIYDVILKTDASANKIGQASNVISSIAEQTNLLALNAAIEAARAGEAGRGFAVVAEEIRKLAEQSSNSTMDIDKMVSDLQANSHDAVATMDRVSAIANEQTNSVTQNKEKYMIISNAMKESADIIEQLNLSSQEMIKMKDEILDTLGNLSAIAQENSAATEEVTASMEEQSAAMAEIANASEDLAGLAQDLQSIIEKFNF